MSTVHNVVHRTFKQFNLYFQIITNNVFQRQQSREEAKDKITKKSKRDENL